MARSRPLLVVHLNRTRPTRKTCEAFAAARARFIRAGWTSTGWWRRSPALDLALIDLRLPDMSGLHVARRLRGERIHVQWILMSGFMDYDVAFEAGKLGALRAVCARLTSKLW